MLSISPRWFYPMTTTNLRDWTGHCDVTLLLRACALIPVPYPRVALNSGQSTLISIVYQGQALRIGVLQLRLPSICFIQHCCLTLCYIVDIFAEAKWPRTRTRASPGTTLLRAEFTGSAGAACTTRRLSTSSPRRP